METQDWEGRVLDKDFIFPGNTVYGPGACCFVSRELNSLLSGSHKHRGQYKTGVFFWGGVFRAKLSIDGEIMRLGRFGSEAAAHKAYCEAKADNVSRVAKQQTDHRLISGLLKHAEIIRNTPLPTAPRR